MVLGLNCRFCETGSPSSLRLKSSGNILTWEPRTLDLVEVMESKKELGGRCCRVQKVFRLKPVKVIRIFTTVESIWSFVGKEGNKRLGSPYYNEVYFSWYSVIREYETNSFSSLYTIQQLGVNSEGQEMIY